MQNCFYINIYIYHQLPTVPTGLVVISFLRLRLCIKFGNTDVVRGYVTEYSFPAVFMTTGISMKRGDPNENSRYVSWR